MSDHGHDATDRSDSFDVFRRRSRVDAFMPLSSLQGLAPVEQVQLPLDNAVCREGTTLAGGCRLYRLPTIRGTRSDP